MKILHRILIPLLGVVILLDGALFAYVKTTYRAIAKEANSPVHMMRYPDKPITYAVPSGFTSKGQATDDPSAMPGGWVVRYSSSHCSFCRKDDARWNQLATNLQKRGYKTIVIPPGKKDEYKNDTQLPLGSQQVVYVSNGWTKQFRLLITPTILIFDAKKGLIWSHRGSLDDHDLSEAERATAGQG